MEGIANKFQIFCFFIHQLYQLFNFTMTIYPTDVGKRRLRKHETTFQLRCHIQVTGTACVRLKARKVYKLQPLGKTKNTSLSDSDKIQTSIRTANIRKYFTMPLLPLVSSLLWTNQKRIVFRESFHI